MCRTTIPVLVMLLLCATSDLKKLVDAALLGAVGDRRGRFYLASDRLQDLNWRIREERKSIPPVPFEDTS